MSPDNFLHNVSELLDGTPTVDNLRLAEVELWRAVRAARYGSSIIYFIAAVSSEAVRTLRDAPFTPADQPLLTDFFLCLNKVVGVAIMGKRLIFNEATDALSRSLLNIIERFDN